MYSKNLGLYLVLLIFMSFFKITLKLSKILKIPPFLITFYQKKNLLKNSSLFNNLLKRNILVSNILIMRATTIPVSDMSLHMYHLKLKMLSAMGVKWQGTNAHKQLNNSFLCAIALTSKAGLIFRL